MINKLIFLIGTVTTNPLSPTATSKISSGTNIEMWDKIWIPIIVAIITGSISGLSVAIFNHFSKKRLQNDLYDKEIELETLRGDFNRSLQKELQDKSTTSNEEIQQSVNSFQEKLHKASIKSNEEIQQSVSEFQKNLQDDLHKKNQELQEKLYVKNKKLQANRAYSEFISNERIRWIGDIKEKYSELMGIVYTFDFKEDEKTKFYALIVYIMNNLNIKEEYSRKVYLQLGILKSSWESFLKDPRVKEETKQNIIYKYIFPRIIDKLEKNIILLFKSEWELVKNEVKNSVETEHIEYTKNSSDELLDKLKKIDKDISLESVKLEFEIEFLIKYDSIEDLEEEYGKDLSEMRKAWDKNGRGFGEDFFEFMKEVEGIE